MKTSSNRPLVFRLLALILLASGLTSAREEQPPKLGFIRLLNAVSHGDGRIDFLIDGQNVRPKGYVTGNVTGGIPVTPGSHDILIRSEALGDATTKVHLPADATVTLIPFAEEIPATKNEPARWVIRILKLKQEDPPTKRGATFVSVSRHPEIKVEIREPDGNWTPVHVKRLAIARAIIRQPRGYLAIRHNDAKLPSVSVAAAGNHVLVLYDDASGELRAKSFNDYKYLSTE